VGASKDGEEDEMTDSTFETLLEQADVAARQGEWETTLGWLAQATELQPEHPGALTGQGTCLIQLGRPTDALSYFRQVVALAPESPEAHNNLGVVYALNGDLHAAEEAYQQAIRLDADHAPAWKNLAMIYLRQNRLAEGVQLLAALVKTNPHDVEALFLLGSCYEEGEDYPSARLLYEQVLQLQPDHGEARQGLERLPRPAPDLSRIARPEHAHKLAALKGLRPAAARHQPERENGNGAGGREDNLRIAFIGPPEPATEIRLAAPAHGLAESGVQVQVSSKFNPADCAGCEAIVFANPHLSPGLVPAIEQCVQLGKRVIVDLDRDFHHLPPGHPGYKEGGPGNPEALRALEAALARASLVTVASQVLAERYSSFASQLEVAPYTWSRANALWSKPSPRRDTLNLGLAGRYTHPKDLEILRKDLVRFLRETPRALLVIGEDFNLYQAFDSLPEARKLFIPPGRVQDFPFLLAHFDLLLVPLRDDLYNQARPDLPLLEAGARSLPWIASPIVAFGEWDAGGLLAEGRGDWYAALKQLAADPVLRQELGEAGWQKALVRESQAIAQRWHAMAIDPSA
jgi:Flp pilus assembly protein TadD